jgi:hypothetical protein
MTGRSLQQGLLNGIYRPLFICKLLGNLETQQMTDDHRLFPASLLCTSLQVQHRYHYMQGDNSTSFVPQQQCRRLDSSKTTAIGIGVSMPRKSHGLRHLASTSISTAETDASDADQHDTLLLYRPEP